jgi:hypothetical protein
VTIRRTTAVFKTSGTHYEVDYRAVGGPPAGPRRSRCRLGRPAGPAADGQATNRPRRPLAVSWPGSPALDPAGSPNGAEAVVGGQQSQTPPRVGKAHAGVWLPFKLRSRAKESRIVMSNLRGLSPVGDVCRRRATPPQLDVPLGRATVRSQLLEGSVVTLGLQVQRLLGQPDYGAVRRKRPPWWRSIPKPHCLSRQSLYPLLPRWPRAGHRGWPTAMTAYRLAATSAPSRRGSGRDRRA